MGRFLGGRLGTQDDRAAKRRAVEGKSPLDPDKKGAYSSYTSENTDQCVRFGIEALNIFILFVLDITVRM